MQLSRIGRAAIGLALTLAVGLTVTPALAAPSETTKAPAASVDINTATAAQLTAVPGIGKVTAQRIVSFRDEHGPFRRVEDVMRVKGIGEKSFRKLKPYLKVSKPR